MKRDGRGAVNLKHLVRDLDEWIEQVDWSDEVTERIVEHQAVAELAMALADRARYDRRASGHPPEALAVTIRGCIWERLRKVRYKDGRFHHRDKVGRPKTSSVEAWMQNTARSCRSNLLGRELSDSERQGRRKKQGKAVLEVIDSHSIELKVAEEEGKRLQENIDAHQVMQATIPEFDDEERDILRALCLGKKRKELAELFGRTPDQITNLRKRFVRKVRDSGICETWEE